MNNNNTLLRRLRPLNVWALAFGCVIGWGAFVNPGKKFLPSAGVAGTGIAMILGALIMIVIAHSYSEMTARYPSAGGEFTFTKACFGKRAAYLCGWFLVAAYLTNVPMNSTALGLIVHGLFGPVLHIGFHYEIAGFDIYAGEMFFAMAVLLLMGMFSIKGVRVAGVIQTILAGCLAFSVIALTCAALSSPEASGANMSPLWGFDRVGNNYIPHEGGMKIAGSILAMLAAAEKLLGFKGKLLIGLAVFSAVLTGILGFYMASSRLIFSMAREGYLPEFLSKVDAKHGTPANAIIFCMIISLSGPVLGREALGWFLDMSAIGASIGYAFTCMSAAITIKKEGGRIIIPVLGACFSFMFMFLQLVPVPGLEGVHFGKESYIMLAVWIILGIIFYLRQAEKITP